MRRGPLFPLGAALVLLSACSSTDDGTPAGDQSPTDPGTPTAAEAVVQPFPQPEATSRRLDLTVAVPDSGGGLDHVELWRRPAGGDWSLASVVADSLTVRTVIPPDGPFGPWEFAAVAIPRQGAAADTLGAAEASVVVPEPITITDRHGEVWEITHAVLAHGMGLHAWEHGIGRNTLRPIIDPALSCPGDPDYLDPDNLAVVLGLVVGGEPRAYKLGDLPDVEVVDDTVGGVPVAVTY